MKHLLLFLLIALLASLVSAVPPSFRDTGAPDGWTVARGETAAGQTVQAKDAGIVLLKTTTPLALPVEATFQFRAALGDSLTFLVTENGAAATAKPLLQSVFRLNGANQAFVTAYAGGAPMATTTISDRTWSDVENKGGSLSYGWRFPRVKNLWDERDRREIGAAYAQLVPFTEKIFTLRMILTGVSRQIWLDDRLVAEERVAGPSRVQCSFQLDKTAQVLSAEFQAPRDMGTYQPLPLASYSHARGAQAADPAAALSTLPGQVPMWMPQTPRVDIDLGQSLDRYRLTTGSGPDAGYVNAQVAWPAAFKVDPASLTFRVPYRLYRNVWLLAWLDDKPQTVPRGTLRFFRENAGYPASTDFEISPAAIQKGLVTKLPRQTADGKALYLVKVPVDTDNFYGFRDMADQFLDFELSKPVSLTRSYPDPIFYQYHPAGLPSSVHVAGITLEEAPFAYTVEPAQTGDIFEQPQQPAYTVTVTNTTGKPFVARVALQTRSYDGTETGGARGQATIGAHATGTVKLAFGLKRLGWHKLRVAVTADGQTRGNTMALVLLPPNTRTYGTAPNETRFGIWALLGHYVPLQVGQNKSQNETMLAMFRRLGLRRISPHESFFNPDMLKRFDFLPNGSHTVGGAFSTAVLPDGTVNPAEMQKAVAGEFKQDAIVDCYFYGGEWAVSNEIQYAPWPRYTGAGDRPLTPVEQANADRHVKIFTAIGRALRAQHPQAKLILQ